MGKYRETNKPNCDCIWLEAHFDCCLLLLLLQFAAVYCCCNSQKIMLGNWESLFVESPLRLDLELELPFALSTLLRHSFRFVFNNHLQMSIRPASPPVKARQPLALAAAHAQRFSKETNRKGKRNWKCAAREYKEKRKTNLWLEMFEACKLRLLAQIIENGLWHAQGRRGCMGGTWFLVNLNIFLKMTRIERRPCLLWIIVIRWKVKVGRVQKKAIERLKL